MVFKSHLASERPTGYPPSGWQPEAELQGPPPRSIRLTWKHAMVLVLALALLFLVFVGVLLPVAGRIYVLHSGSPATATVVHLRETITHGPRGALQKRFLSLSYRTPKGVMVKSTEVSPKTYSSAHLGAILAIHYMKKHPDQIMVDQDQSFHIGPAAVIILVELALAAILTRLLTTELKIVRTGSLLPGMIVAQQATGRRSITVYFEHQGTNYQVRIVQKRGVSTAEWQPGKAMTMMVENLPGSAPAARPRVVPYPFSVFKCTTN